MKGRLTLIDIDSCTTRIMQKHVIGQIGKTYLVHKVFQD